MKRERIEVVLRGRVQGVGFRLHAADVATRFGVAGFVRNLPGGSALEVVAEGERSTLEGFLEALARGPATAKVDEVKARWSDPTEEFARFEIRS